MRNREMLLYVLVGGLIGAAGVIVAFLQSIAAGLICLVLALLLIAWGVLFSFWRYMQIKKLSSALAHATTKGVVLDVRTNREGELSILRNDLYKLSAALVAQADMLRNEKMFLANSLSDISHQIKTPLTSLLVLSDLLQNEDLPKAKRKEFLARITTQLERIRWLVTSLLKISRVDAAVVVFKKEPIALHRMLSEAMEPLLPLAEEKNVAVGVVCPRSLQWHGDMDWMQEAVANIAKNCIEHAPCGGSVQISCKENPINIVLAIEDDGPGFAEQDLLHLFERFFQGAHAVGGGVGIGLAMARAIMLAQGADITAGNKAGGGARFEIKLNKVLR